MMKLCKISENEYTDFVSKHNYRLMFTQTYEYIKTVKKMGNLIECVGLKNDINEIVAISVVYYQPWKKIFLRAKIIHGPILDYNNSELLETFVESLLDYLKKNKRVLSLRLSAMLDYHFYQGTQLINNNLLADSYIQNMQKLGGILVKQNDSESDDVPIRFMYSKDLSGYDENNIFSSMRKKLAGPFLYGMTCELLTIEDFAVLQKMMNFTSKRKGFTITSPHAFELYKNYWKENENSVFVPAVYLDLDKFLLASKFERLEYIRLIDEANILNFQSSDTHKFQANKYRDDLKDSQLLADFDIFTQVKNLRNKKGTKKFLNDYRNQLNSLNEKIEKVIKLKNEGLTKIIIAAAMFIQTKTDFIYIGAGYDSRFANFNASYYMHHEMIKLAIKNNIKIYNLFGISGDFSAEAVDAGVMRFKKEFNGFVEELVPALDFVFWPKFIVKYLGGIE